MYLPNPSQQYAHNKMSCPKCNVHAHFSNFAVKKLRKRTHIPTSGPGRPGSSCAGLLFQGAVDDEDVWEVDEDATDWVLHVPV